MLHVRSHLPQELISTIRKRQPTTYADALYASWRESEAERWFVVTLVSNHTSIPILVWAGEQWFSSLTFCPRDFVLALNARQVFVPKMMLLAAGGMAGLVQHKLSGGDDVDEA